MSDAVSTEVVSEPVSTPATTQAQVEGQTSEAATTSPAVAQEKTKEEIDFAARFAALTRQERRILDEKKKMSELQKSYQDDPDRKLLEQIKALKANPRQSDLKSIESILGLSYKDLTDMALNDGKPPLEAQLEELRAALKRNEDDKAAEAQRVQEARNQAAVEQYKRTIMSHVENNADTFELIKLHDAYNLCIETAEAWYEKNGQIPDPVKIAEAVEKWLEDQAKPILSAKKFQPKVAETPAVQEESSSNTSAKTTQAAPKTLSNKDVASAPVSSTDLSLMDPEKRLKWTAAKLKAALAQG